MQMSDNFDSGDNSAVISTYNPASPSTYEIINPLPPPSFVGISITIDKLQ